MSNRYALYLVTDSTPAVLGSKDLVEVVRQALEGGVTIVQYRDKQSSTKELMQTARKIHNVTKRYGVPLIVNDRVDVALAVGAEGVHLGQDDMDLATAREMLGPSSIIGISCNNLSEANTAILGGADYLGVGTIFATPTKPDAKDVIGIDGCRTILEGLASTEAGAKIDAVAIGGINATNADQVMTQSPGGGKTLSGLAVVSAVVAADDPRAAAQALRQLITAASRPRQLSTAEPQRTLDRVRQILERVRSKGPLCHNMTNLVVQNFVANVTLAVGAKPIMAMDGREAADLAKLGGSLVINMGTADETTMTSFVTALQAYNGQQSPVVLDPVGAGATTVRRSNTQRLLSAGRYAVIKGNESEIQVVGGAAGAQQRGVDSSNTLHVDAKRDLVRAVARTTHGVVLMTGAADYLSDGKRTVTVRNGHHLLAAITGAGCALGSVIAACLAVEKDDSFLATLAGLLLYTIAAERAVHDQGPVHPPTRRVTGSGTFVPAFIDALGELTSSNFEWLTSADFETL